MRRFDFVFTPSFTPRSQRRSDGSGGSAGARRSCDIDNRSGRDRHERPGGSLGVAVSREAPNAHLAHKLHISSKVALKARMGRATPRAVRGDPARYGDLYLTICAPAEPPEPSERRCERGVNGSVKTKSNLLIHTSIHTTLALSA